MATTPSPNAAELRALCALPTGEALPPSTAFLADLVRDRSISNSHVLPVLGGHGTRGASFPCSSPSTTGADGDVSFTFSTQKKVSIGQAITATVTGAQGTSELTAPKQVVRNWPVHLDEGHDRSRPSSGQKGAPM